MAGLRDLARSLGLSVATVSRALDGQDTVAPATRERVLAAARAANYSPNAAARRLSKGRSEVVSLVLPTAVGQFNEPLYIQLLSLIGLALSKRGYDLSLFAAPPGEEEAALYRRIVESRRADGLIIVRTRRDDPRVRYLQDVGFPFVCMGRTDSDRPYAYVDADGEKALHDATRRVIALGHRRILHLAAPSAFSFAGHRRRGYLRAMAEAGLEPQVVECVADEAHGHDAARSSLAGPGRPTAILAATDRQAHGVLHAAREAGLVVPRDLSVLGYDNLTASAYTDPPLSSLELPLADASRKLADFVLARIDGVPAEDLQAVLDVVAIDRGSVGPPPSEGA
ncbi:LacI family DNA-binding transcriptional regulator [Prosthecomicrobium sp. N25]|uniref:LacI family DNA-binding transcriptional regulator n=1 Tax=Prosthecomicrobium sp. N25 TaxID=3129254 RepID=UPI003077CD40